MHASRSDYKSGRNYLCTAEIAGRNLVNPLNAPNLERFRTGVKDMHHYKRIKPLSEAALRDGKNQHYLHAAALNDLFRI